MTLWFTADHHFGHANIIEYTNRPFDNVEQMDEALITAWNDVVEDGDLVYHLGDFTLSDWPFAKSVLQRLNGNFWFLYTPWHHDKGWIKRMRAMVESGLQLPSTIYARLSWLTPLSVLTLSDYDNHGYPMKLTLCHYPMEVWEASHYNAWHIHGHSHGKKDAGRERCILDVGVDNAYRLLGEWRPFSLEEVAGIMRERGAR